MKRRKAHTMGAFAMAAILTAQTLFSPFVGVLAAEENDTGGTNMTDFTTYEAYNLNQVDVTDAYLTNAEDKDIEYTRGGSRSSA